MAQKLFYTYKHGSDGAANNSFVPSTYIFSYWDSLVFDVNHRTIWHQGMPFGNVYPGTNSYGEIFNDLERNIAKGAYSHAEGYNTMVNGDYSHVEGYGTSSEGTYSHAEGESTIVYVSARGSHVEGYSTSASAKYGHAEGINSSVSGDYGHAEGNFTHAEGVASHAEGNFTYAIEFNSHAEGNSTHAEGINSHAEGDQTTASGNASHSEGIGSKAEGVASHAEGSSQNYCDYAHSEGSSTIVSESTYSHTEGNSVQIEQSESAHAEGIESRIYNSIGSHAEGYGTSITASTYAHVEGNKNTTTQSNYSHNEGSDNALDKSNYTHVEGKSNAVSRDTSDQEDINHVEGSNNVVKSTEMSHIEGNNHNVTSSTCIHVEGDTIKVDEKSNYLHAEGKDNFSYKGSEYSHIEGRSNVIYAPDVHIEGHNSYSIGKDSHIEGSFNKNYGYLTHVEGSNNSSYSSYSHVEGFSNKSIGDYSHIEGANSYTYSSYSHVGGLGSYSYSGNLYGFLHGSHVIAKNIAEVSFGTYNYCYNGNANNKDTIFTLGVGNGVVVNGQPTRKNAFDVRTDGVAYFYTYIYTWDNVAEDQIGAYTEICEPHLQPVATITYVARNAVGRRNFATENGSAKPKYIGAEYFNNYGQSGLRMNMAYADFSHAEGKTTATYGEGSHAEGISTVTYNTGEHASGKYNKSVRNETLFSVGCGTGEETENRKNAFHINDLGNAENGIAFVNDNPIVTSVDRDGDDGITGNTRSTYLWKGNLYNYDHLNEKRNDDTIYFVYDDGGASRDELISLSKFNELKNALINQLNDMISKSSFLMNANQKKNNDGSLFFNGAYVSSETKYVWSGTKTLYDAMPESMKSANDTIFIITNN